MNISPPPLVLLRPQCEEEMEPPVWKQARSDIFWANHSRSEGRNVLLPKPSPSSILYMDSNINGLPFDDGQLAVRWFRHLRAAFSWNYRPVCSDVQFVFRKNKSYSVDVVGNVNKLMSESLSVVGNLLVCVFIIRHLEKEIRQDTSKSKICRKVAEAIANKTRKLWDETFQKYDIEQYDEHVFTGFRRLETFIFYVTKFRPLMYCFVDLVMAIYNDEVIGGQVMDLIEKHRNSLEYGCEAPHLNALMEVAWTELKEFLQLWLSSNSKDIEWTASLEFFIWSNDVVDMLKDEKREPDHLRPMAMKSMSELNLRPRSTRSEGFTLITDLCPNVLKKHAEAIFQIGEELRTTGEKDLPIFSIDWESSTLHDFEIAVENSKMGSRSGELQFLFKKYNLPSIMRLLYETFLFYRSDRLLNILVDLEIINSPYRQVQASNAQKKKLSRLGNLTSMSDTHLGVEFGFDFLDYDVVNVVESRHLNEKLPKSKSCSTFEDETDIEDSVFVSAEAEVEETLECLPKVYERVTIVANIPNQLLNVISHDVLKQLGWIFTIRLLLEHAVFSLSHVKLQYRESGVALKESRFPLQALRTIAGELERILSALESAVSNFFKALFPACSACNSVSEFVQTQLKLLDELLTNAGLDGSGKADISYVLTIAERFQTNYINMLGADEFRLAFDDWEQYLPNVSGRIY